MSLAARCPACGTVFRVVHDQLRVSEGWVRCGRCTEVFNAITNMVDLEADLPAPASASAVMRRGDTAGARPARAAADLGRSPVQPVQPVPPAAPAPAEQHAEPPAPVSMSSSASLPTSTPGASPSTGLRDDSVDTLIAAAMLRPSAPVEIAADATYTASGASNGAAAHVPAATPAPGDVDPPPPPFVRRAERAALWRQPAVRAGLAGLALVCALALALQVALTYRDGVAARWPALRPALEALCASAGCRIEAPRSIESLEVQSSGLVRIEGTTMYRLSVVLINRSPLALALPSVDLTLTDTRGDVIARRALTPGEMRVAATSLPGRGQRALQATLQVADRPVSGYTIEIFYP